MAGSWPLTATPSTSPSHACCCASLPADQPRLSRTVKAPERAPCTTGVWGLLPLQGHSKQHQAGGLQIWSVLCMHRTYRIRPEHQCKSCEQSAEIISGGVMCTESHSARIIGAWQCTSALLCIAEQHDQSTIQEQNHRHDQSDLLMMSDWQRSFKRLSILAKWLLHT